MSYEPMKMIYGEVHMYGIVCVMYNTYLMMICSMLFLSCILSARSVGFADP
jgi:hypothetical protein